MKQEQTSCCKHHRSVKGRLVVWTVFVALFTPGLQASDLSGEAHFSRLKGRIVRAMTVAPFDAKLVVTGSKGQNAGDGKVFISRDGGVSWRFLNGNRALSNATSDVQAVAVINPQTMLAGTWKTGLYRSIDGGQNFSPVSSFATKDVRSLAVSTRQAKTVFAATGGQGVMKSVDAGQSWTSTSLNSGFIWSVRAHPRGHLLLAASQGGGLYTSSDEGTSWSHALAKTKVFEADMSLAGAPMIAVAAEDGFYLSSDWQTDSNWFKPPQLAGKRLSSVRFSPHNPDIILLGDWAGGIWAYSISKQEAVQSSAKLPVVHLEATDGAVFAGSWGQGIHVYPQQDDSASLIDAATVGDLKVVEKLLDAGVNPDVTDANLNTPLIFASRDGHANVVKLLIERRADVNWIDGEGVTPLILAAYKNHPEIVKTLLDEGADPSVVDGFGRTALEYAQRRGDSDSIAKMIRDAGTG